MIFIKLSFEKIILDDIYMIFIKLSFEKIILDDIY